MVKDFKKVATINPELQKVSDNLREFVKPLINSEIVDGVLLKDISLITGQDNVVSHKLGRKINGWIPVRIRANSVVWDLQDSNVIDTSTLILRSSVNVTIDLWIF